MQPGMIILWYGSLLDIPDGWVICDGTGETAQILGLWVVGAGNLYDAGEIPGGLPHNHTETYLANRHQFVAGAWMYLGGLFQEWTTMDFDTFTSDRTQLRPPYHALYYIQKT